MKGERITVYVIFKYTASTRKQRIKNVKEAMDLALPLLILGYAPLIPTLTHYMDEYYKKEVGFDVNHNSWLEIDLAWMKYADVIQVGDCEGSKGAAIEIAFAKKNKIPIVYSFEELGEWRTEHDAKVKLEKGR